MARWALDLTLDFAPEVMLLELALKPQRTCVISYSFLNIVADWWVGWSVGGGLCEKLTCCGALGQSREGSGVTGKLHLDFVSVRANRIYHAPSADSLFISIAFELRSALQAWPCSIESPVKSRSSNVTRPPM
jgi:hypothetical protein